MNWNNSWGRVVDVTRERTGHLASREIVVVSENVLDATLGEAAGDHCEENDKSEDLRWK